MYNTNQPYSYYNTKWEKGKNDILARFIWSVNPRSSGYLHLRMHEIPHDLTREDETDD